MLWIGIGIPTKPKEAQVIHYLDDHIKVNYTGTILDFNEEESNHILEEYRDTLHSNIPCERCKECIHTNILYGSHHWVNHFFTVCSGLPEP
jgi:hypothetical protein